MKFYVYAILDPRVSGKFTFARICFLNEPIYIGKGSGNRSKWHMRRSDKHPLTNKIAKIKEAGLAPIILKICTDIDEQTSYDLEKQMIEEIGMIKNGGTLTNLSEGGYGSFSGCQHTEEHKKRMSEYMTNSHPFKGKKLNLTEEGLRSRAESIRNRPVTDEWRERGRQLGLKNTGRTATAETREKLSKAAKGKITSDTVKQKISEANTKYKQIVATSPQNEVATFNSINDLCQCLGFRYNVVHRGLKLKGPVVSRGIENGWSFRHNQ